MPFQTLTSVLALFLWASSENTSLADNQNLTPCSSDNCELPALRLSDSVYNNLSYEYHSEILENNDFYFWL